MKNGNISSNIKKSFLLTVILSFVTASSIWAGKSIAMGYTQLDGSVAKGAVAAAQPADANDMSVTMTLSGFSTEKSSLNNQSWQTLSFENECLPDNVGAPALPLLRKYFAVPEDANISIEVADVTYETFENAMIAPCQQALLESETTANRAFAKNDALYATNSFYPSQWAAVGETVVMRDVHMATLMVNPLQYNPVTQTLKAASKITLKIRWTAPNGNSALTFPKHLANAYRGLLLNYGFMAYRAIPSNASENMKKATDYLIIVDSKLANSPSLKSLADYHSSQGKTVEVKSTADVGSSADGIKSHIQSAYNTNELDFVLLVGDLPGIPHKASAYQGVASDSWYSWLKGNDQLGDVALGRMPATDENELKNMVTKTLNFHNMVAPGDWRKKSILIAHRENAPNKYTACKNRIYNHTYKLDPPTMDKKYGSQGATNNQVTEAINEGRVVVNYRGHGSATAWTGWNGSSYSTTAAKALKNGSKTPVVYCIACLNGDMGRSSDCLAEAFMCGPEGAVCVLAANDPSYTTVNHDFDEALYFGTWDEGIEAQGDLRNYADAEALRLSGSMSRKNAAMYIWFGDPSINVLKGNTAPFATVMAPNGGELWEKGTSQQITWGDNINGNMKIEIFKGGSMKEVLSASTPSTGTFEWKIPADYATGADYKVKITSVDSSALNDESNENFSIIPEYILVCPYFQNFDTLTPKTEVLPLKYVQAADDDLNWTVYNGPTPSRVDDPPDATGPKADHTTGTDKGNYIYTEASASNNGNPNKKFTYLTPKFNFKGISSPELSFWYHMFSDNAGEDHMGKLMLDISVDGTWKNDVITIQGNKGDKWIEQKLDLTPYKGERVIFRFRAVTGDSWESDISIDDLKIDGAIPIGQYLTQKPRAFDLKLNGSRLQFQVPDNGIKSNHVSIKLFNMQGKMIKTLVNKNYTTGIYTVAVDSRISLAAGMYMCRMETKGYSKTINLLLNK